MSTHRARRSRRLPLLAVVAAAGVAAPSVAAANTPATADTTRPTAVQAPDDYYQDATGKSGPELKAALTPPSRRRPTTSSRHRRTRRPPTRRPLPRRPR
ncbi:hypothetical protein ACWEWX_54860, partial [Streptomyces asiaticus]